jgi:hypothetical protein
MNTLAGFDLTTHSSNLLSAPFFLQKLLPYTLAGFDLTTHSSNLISAPFFVTAEQGDQIARSLILSSFFKLQT